MWLPGNTFGPSNGWHGCTHGDSTMTPQRKFVSIKNADDPHKKVKKNYFPFFIKRYPFDIDSCKDSKYSLFWIYNIIFWNKCFCVCLCAKKIYMTVTSKWPLFVVGSADPGISIGKTHTECVDIYGSADPGRIRSANNLWWIHSQGCLWKAMPSAVVVLNGCSVV